MFYFTFYCFARVFQLTYSGANPTLTAFFKSMSTESLISYVNGKRNPKRIIQYVEINSKEAENVVENIPIATIKNVYKKVIGDTKRITKKEMLRELLTHSLHYSQETQKQVFLCKKDAEFDEYIQFLCRIDNSTNGKAIFTPVEKGKKDISTTQLNDVIFSFIVEKQINAIESVQILCNVYENWLDTNNEQNRLLQELCERNVPVQVLLSNGPKPKYKPRQRDFISKWKTYVENNPNITLHKFEMNLSHNTICCNFKNEKSIMSIGIYTNEGNGEIHCPTFLVKSSDESYAYFSHECEYLLSISKEI